MATALNWESLARHRAVLLKTYGSKTATKWRQFIFDLFSVSCGVKRSWLVDYFLPDAEKLQSVMGSVLNHEPNMNRKNMCIVSVNDDLLVVNIEDTLSACEELMRIASVTEDWTRHQHSLSLNAGVCEFVILDSSSNQHHATEDELAHIHRELLPVVRTLQDEISAIKCVSQPHLVSPDSVMCVPHITITVPEGVNLCTLFGWLLGYPFVYWFPYSNVGSEVGLSMVPLTCYKVCYVSSEAVTGSSSTSAGMETDNHPLVLYSFSVPTSVLTSNPFTSEVIRDWFERIKVSSSKLLNVNIQQTTICLTLPHVIL